MTRADSRTGLAPASRAEGTEGGCGDRPLRADAKLNRQRILEAAEEIFTKEGISVPVDAVAERACVGVGTLYRHFPTKEALFEAIVLDKLEGLIAAARVDDADDPTEGFFSFLLQIADEASLKHDLFDALAASGVDFKSRCGDRVQELQQSLDRLRQRAVDCGGIRGDVTIDQIMVLVIGASRGMEHSGMENHEPRQIVGIICDGLRARR